MCFFFLEILQALRLLCMAFIFIVFDIGAKKKKIGVQVFP